MSERNSYIKVNSLEEALRDRRVALLPVKMLLVALHVRESSGQTKERERDKLLDGDTTGEQFKTLLVCKRKELRGDLAQISKRVLYRMFYQVIKESNKGVSLSISRYFCCAQNKISLRCAIFDLVNDFFQIFFGDFWRYFWRSHFLPTPLI